MARRAFARLAGLCRRREVLLAVLGAAVAAAAVFLLPARRSDAPPGEVAPVEVEVERIRPLAVAADTFEIDGTVEPNRVVNVPAEVAGRIERYALRGEGSAGRPGREKIEQGDRVSAGDPIMFINSDILQAEHDRAEAERTYNEAEFRRLEDLYRKQVATKKELDEARTAWQVSEALHRLARERLKRAEIRAPIAGVLNRLLVEEGEYVKEGGNVAEIVDDSVMQVAVDVPEKDIGYLRQGTRHTIQAALPRPREVTDAEGRTTYRRTSEVPGTITYISETADPAARTTRIELTIEDAYRHLFRSGQFVTVELSRGKLSDVVMIPIDAVIPQEDGRYTAYVVVDGEAQQRSVELDMRMIRRKRIRVLSGLTEGDRLIVKGQRYCAAGQTVREPAVVLSSPPEFAIDCDGAGGSEKVKAMAERLAVAIRRLKGVQAADVLNPGQQESPVRIDLARLAAPLVEIVCRCEGLSRERVASEVTERLEAELHGLEKVWQVTPVSEAGASRIAVQFRPGVGRDDALRQVRDRLRNARTVLPREAEAPRLSAKAGALRAEFLNEYHEKPRGARFLELAARAPEGLFADMRVEDLVIARWQGLPIYVSDVAEVGAPYRAGHQAGRDTVTIAVRRRDGADAADLARRIDAVLRDFRRIAPDARSFKATKTVLGRAATAAPTPVSAKVP
jgi:membrane fusion protein (multidrug efflux system)